MFGMMLFAVDPEEIIERKEQRLSIVGDHLGFSWTGESGIVRSRLFHIFITG